MAAVTICSDFETPQNKVSLFLLFPHLFAMKWWDWNAMIFIFWMLSFKLQLYANQKFPDAQAGFRKGEGTRDQIANIHWIIEKAREFQKKHLFHRLKPLTVWIMTNCKKLLECWELPDHLTYLLRNLYAGQEATVKNPVGNKWLAQDRERSMTGLSAITLLV